MKLTSHYLGWQVSFEESDNGWIYQAHRSDRETLDDETVYPNIKDAIDKVRLRIHICEYQQEFHDWISEMPQTHYEQGVRFMTRMTDFAFPPKLGQKQP